MTPSYPSLAETGAFDALAIEDHTYRSGISWSAVIAGAIVIAAMSFILLALGAGLGLSTMAPWSAPRALTKVISIGTIIWLVIMQAISGSLGGWLAGRLRIRWIRIHSDETYFRDTAHGFLAWGLALCGSVAFLAAASAVMVGGAAAARTDADEKVAPNAYFVDVMLRSATPVGSASQEVRGELERILARALVMARLEPDDKVAAGRIISQTTGIIQAAAEQRTIDVVAMAARTADNAKDALGHSLLWAFLGLLVGAFCASAAATIGGRQRDHLPSI